MSIPQAQIVYTGLNTARPDWKGFTKDINSRLDQVRRESQQQKQFEVQRQDQLNRQFLKTIDADRINFTEATFKQKAADIYGATDEIVSAMVKESRGKMTFQNTLAAQQIFKQAEQELAVNKFYEENWTKDKQTYLNPKNAGKFDEASAKEKIFGYKGDTTYGESRLELIKWSPQQFADKIKPLYRDANKRSVVLKAGGLGDIEGGNEEQYKTSFVSKLYDVKDVGGVRTLVLKEDKAIQELKALSTSQDFSQGRIGLMESFDKLKETEQEFYREKAEKITGNEEDAMFSWFLDNEGEDLYPRTYSEQQEKAASTKLERTRNKSGNIVDLLTTPRNLNVAGQEYDNVYSLPKAVNIPSFTIKGAQEIVDGKLSAAKDAVYKGRLTDVITENGKITKLKIEVPSGKVKTDSEGNKLYTLRGLEGTKEELLSLSKKQGYSWSSGYIDRNADPMKETDKTKTIIAPASENKSLTELFRIQGISKIGESAKTKDKILW